MDEFFNEIKPATVGENRIPLRLNQLSVKNILIPLSNQVIPIGTALISYYSGSPVGQACRSIATDGPEWP